MKYFIAIALTLVCYPLFAQRHDNVLPSGGLTVTGAIKKELIYSIADLAKRAQDKLGDLVIRNHKGEPKDTVKGLKGILLKTLLDGVEMNVEKPKEYSEFYISLIATDGYKNIYSWNELFNTEVGNHIYIITEMDGKSMQQMEQRILVISLADFNTGRRLMKALAKIVFEKAN